MHDHYKKDVTGLKFVDVYRVCKLFNVTDPCIQHAVKKLLCAGQRGAKSESQDVQEAIDTLKRYQEMQGETRVGYAHPLPVQKPWYPDDSGDWVEFKGNRSPVELGVKCELLLNDERKQKNYKKVVYPANCFDWTEAVAYKVIK